MAKKLALYFSYKGVVLGHDTAELAAPKQEPWLS